MEYPGGSQYLSSNGDSVTTADKPLTLNRRAHPTASKTRHAWLLIVASVIVALSLALEVRPGERVAFGGLPDYPLPHACYSRTLFGVKCPGCGLTRSFIHLAHGDWRASWQVHRLGWLLAAIVLLQFPYRIAMLAGAGRWALGPRWAGWLGAAVLGLLLANWVFS